MSLPAVLVTGGAGYIGSHVCKALSLQGFAPIAYDNLCSGNAEAVKWGPLEQGDVRNAARLAEVMALHKPVAIMHFAALIKVGESVTNPAEYYDNNVRGSGVLLDAARAAGVQHMVFSSTAAVYGVPQAPLISESHPLSPINPYGNTKLVMENMIRDYAAAYGLHYAIFRYFNAAGADPEGELGSAYPADSHIIPLLTQVAAGMRAEMSIFGNDYDTPDGTALRDYVHVTDLASAHVLALQHLLKGGENLTLNLGTNQGYSVLQALELARKVSRQPIPAVMCARRAGDPAMLVADAAAARRLLGWTPVHSALEDIIATAWSWRQKQQEYGRTGAFLPSHSPSNRSAA